MQLDSQRRGWDWPQAAGSSSGWDACCLAGVVGLGLSVGSSGQCVSGVSAGKSLCCSALVPDAKHAINKYFIKLHVPNIQRYLDVIS